MHTRSPNLNILLFSAFLSGFSGFVSAESEVSVENYDPAILAQGIANAPGISPPDAPKDKYGKPYIIGDLGGQKVNLPASVVRFVEYDDSPGWDPEKIKRFRPPVRSYASILESFGFYFRLHDKRLYDRADVALYHQFEAQRWASGNDWIRVGVRSRPRHNYNRDYLDDLLHDRVDKSDAESLPTYYYQPTGETFFGLAVYINPGINPKTGRPWREDFYASDLFIAKNENGRVTDVIECANVDVPRPPCTHYFVMPERYLIRLSLMYNRDMLPYWQAIAANTRRFLWSFVVEPQPKPRSE